MREKLRRAIALAFLAIALTLAPSLITEQASAFAQAQGELHHTSSATTQIGRRRNVRRGAIGAGGAGLYNVKARRRGSVRRAKVLKKKPVMDDTDIVH